MAERGSADRPARLIKRRESHQGREWAPRAARSGSRRAVRDRRRRAAEPRLRRNASSPDAPEREASSRIASAFEERRGERDSSWRGLEQGPCAICRRWFHPDPRIGARQRACSRPCGAALRKRTQERWRAANAGYAIAWRIQKRSTSEEPPAPRVPPPLTRLPWDLAKDEFGGQGADFIGAFGRLVVGFAKDERRAQVRDIALESGGLSRGPPKDEIGRVTG